MTTCFATVGALASLPGPPSEEDVYQLVQLTPQERLKVVVEHIPAVEQHVEKALGSYAWFLEQTGQSEEKLHEDFADPQLRRAGFDRALEYGDLMFALLRGIAQTRDPASERLLRFLVI